MKRSPSALLFPGMVVSAFAEVVWGVVGRFGGLFGHQVFTGLGSILSRNHNQVPILVFSLIAVWI